MPSKKPCPTNPTASGKHESNYVESNRHHCFCGHSWPVAEADRKPTPTPESEGRPDA